MQNNPPDRRIRAIRLWLMAVAAIVFVLVVVGGATRLTESGLSIVEWKPVTGSIPPLSEPAWQAEFEKYRQIPQYKELNRGMSLDEFKTIYWWEWTHRFLGRFVGVAFLIPFLIFLWRGWIGPGLRWRLWTIFALGGVQGAVGWWMVASGLADRISVSQYRLAFHLTLACVIFAALIWTAQRLTPRTADASPRLRGAALTLLLGVVFQIYLGALVAGLDAGLVYNTWPLIDGGIIPDTARLFFAQPAWLNFFENPLMVQFNHRMFAYALWIGAVIHAFNARKSPAARGGALGLAVVITGQAAIGIVTLLHQAPISLALLHQAMAVVTLWIAVTHAARLSPQVAAAPKLTPVEAHR